MLRLASMTMRDGALRRTGSSSSQVLRLFASKAKTAKGDASKSRDMLRNIGISAHIDSGKTTLTERILFYTGRINAIHEVRGKDGVGAKMDSMELEREKGITIQSAATYCEWGDHMINIIDTPGHVDFTVEVERALRCLDGAVLVLCGVSGVQSQSITVDRQMKRYSVPRVAFINKLDRAGSNPSKVIGDLREKLRLNAAAVQIAIGLEDQHQGAVDLVRMRAIYYEGDNGETLREDDIPDELVEEAESARNELIERIAEVDDSIAELFLMEEEVDAETLSAAIRKATIGLELVPVFLGSAFKNKGVQALLNGVVSYLPSPLERSVSALDIANDEAKVSLDVESTDAPTVALAFKLEEGRFGQLTYMRVYQGQLERGGQVVNTTTGKKIKVPRLVRMNSNEMEDIDCASAGEICAMFGVDCSSGDTFCSPGTELAMSSMFVPEPVISLAVEPKDSASTGNFSKALQRFRREDPTFRAHVDPESKQTVISGMGELHLEVYIERMKREYGVEVVTGRPRVAYRETVTRRAEFNYLHKKQSGGSGQFGRVIGYVEPLGASDPTDDDEDGDKVPKTFVFENQLVGNNIPPEFLGGIEKGFQDAMEKGALSGHPVQGVRIVLQDGAAHAVDSSEMAFRTAARDAFRSVFPETRPAILEPVMTVDVEGPEEFQGVIVAGLNRRKGVILNSELDDMYCKVTAEVPLSEMFGFSTDLRSSTQGKGEFTMAYAKHAQAMRDRQEEIIREYKESL